MNVESILKLKGTKVLTISPGASVADAVDMLARNGVGALVVSEDDARVQGILSERDIVRALADRGHALLNDSVASLMTRSVFTCEPKDSIDNLMAMMTQRRIRHIPVLRDGMLGGIVSIGDVVKNRIEEVEWEASTMRSFIAGA